MRKTGNWSWGKAEEAGGKSSCMFKQSNNISQARGENNHVFTFVM